jgi:hypothetical protein
LIRDLNAHAEQFKDQGFTILNQVFNAESIQTLFEKFQEQREMNLGMPIGGNSSYLISNCIR